jgi:hypothetical protein
MPALGLLLSLHRVLRRWLLMCQVRPWIVLHETTSLADMESGRLDPGAVRHPVAMGKPSWVLQLLLGSSAGGRKCSPVSRGTRSFLFFEITVQ